MAADDQNPSRGGDRPLRKQGEEVIGKFAQDLLESPLVSGTLSAVFETRERATRAQEVAMSALNLPSAADIERLTRRVRSVAQRIEGVEDNLDRITDKLERIGKVSSLAERLGAIETALERIEQKLAEPPAAAAVEPDDES
jgi:predicted  nucleic acid-binding Zn-ribbon protein